MSGSTPPPKRRLSLRVILALVVIATAVAARLAHDRAARRVVQLEAEARISFEHGKPEEAERKLRMALALAPASPRALALLSAVKLSLGRPDEAEQELRAALARSPSEPVIVVALASTLAARGRADQGWEVLGPHVPALSAIKEPMERVQLLVAAAHVANARGAAADAERILRDAGQARAGETAPLARVIALRALGRHLATSGRLDEADAVLVEALAASPHDLATVTQRALVLEHLGRRDDGIALLQAAPIESSGAQKLDALSTLADLLVRAGRFRDARLLATSIGQDPELFALASYVTGSVSFALADYKDAEAAFARLAAAYPGSAWPHLVRARAALLAEAPAQARAEYAAAERLRPGAPEIALGLLRLDETSGQPEAVFERALALLADHGSRAGALRALETSPLRAARQRAIAARLGALLVERPQDPWLRFHASIFRLLEKDASGAAELDALARSGPDLERAFEPQSRVDLVGIDRIESLEWTALLARGEPLLGPGRAALATIYLRLGRRDLAQAALEPLLAAGAADEPPARGALLLWASLVTDERDVARTAEVLLRLVDAALAAPLLAALAELKHRLGDRAAAGSLLARAADAAPRDAVLRGRLALLQAERSEFDAARASFDAARALAPGDFVANLDGALALGRGDRAAAEAAFRRALEATGDPRFAAALAATLALLDKPAAGVAALAPWRAKFAELPETPLLEGMLLALAGDARARDVVGRAAVPAAVRAAALAATTERAAPSLELFALGILGWLPGHRERLERAVASKDADALAVWWATRALRAGDPPRTREALARRLAELTPGETAPALELAKAQHAAGDPRGAVATVKALLEKTPGEPGLELRLGMLHDAAGESTEALVCYEHAHARSPSAAALNNIAWSLARSRAPTAINYAREAVRLDPNLGEACDTLGWIVLQTGKLEEAELLLERAAALLPESPGVRFRLGQLFHARGERARAIHHVQIALRSPRRFEDAEKARGLLEQLLAEEKR